MFHATNSKRIFNAIARFCERLQRRRALLAAVAAIALGPSALADSSWIGFGVTTNWTNAFNWAGGVPEKSSSENVVFTQAGGPTTLNEDWTLLGLVIGTSGEFGDGDWLVSNGSRLTLHGSINYTSSGCSDFLDCPPQIFFPILLGNNAILSTQTSANSRIDYLANINTNGFFLVSNPMGGAIHLRSTVTGGGGFIQRGDKATIMYGKNTYAGPTLIEQGTLRLFDGGFLPDQSVVTIEAAGTLRIDPVNSGGRTDAIAGLKGAGRVDLRGGSQLFMGNFGTTSPGNGDFSGTIFGSGGIGKRGSGTQTLNGTLDFNGSILVEEGKLTIGPAANIMQTPNVSISSGATFQIDSGSHFDDISNAGNVVVNGQATINSFSGSGNLSINNDTTIGNLSGNSAVSIASGAVLDAFGDFSGVTSGDGGLNAKTLTIRNRLSHAGTTTIDTFGFLSVTDGGRLSDASVIDMQESSVLSLGSGITDAISGLNGVGNVRIGFDAQLVIGNYAGFNAVGEGDFAGQIQGLGALIKRGSNGTQVLSTYNSYLGGTIIEEGVLELRSPEAPTSSTPSMLGSGNVTVKTGGTLAGIGSTGAGLVAVTDGRLSPGIDGSGTLLVNALTLSDTSVVSIDLGGTAAGEFDLLEVVNAAALNGSLEIQLDDGFEYVLGDTFDVLVAETISGEFDSFASSRQGALSLQSQVLTDAVGTSDVVRLTVVPTPTSLALLAPMCLLIARSRCRQR